MIGADQFSIQMCRIGNAQVAASKSERSAQGANCNDVARTGGLVFDSCWRADGTVKGSEICVGNRLFKSISWLLRRGLCEGVGDGLRAVCQCYLLFYPRAP